MTAKQGLTMSESASGSTSLRLGGADDAIALGGTFGPTCPSSGCEITPGVVLVALIVLGVCLLIGYLTRTRR